MRSQLVAVALLAGCAAKSVDQTDGRASEITPAKKPAQSSPSSGEVPEHLGLNAKFPPMAVSEWLRDTDGKFNEQRRQIMLDQVLRDGWVKMIVLEHYSCIPCKVLIETLSRIGPRDADLVVLAVRERDDMDRQDNATREALAAGRGWLVVYRDGVEAMDQIISRIDRTIDGERFPTLFIVDRTNHVRAAATGGETVRILRWVGQQVRDAYAADTQPLASLAGVTAPKELQVAREKINKKVAPSGGSAPPIKSTASKQEGSNAATSGEALPGDRKPVEEDWMLPEDLGFPDGITGASRWETRRPDSGTPLVKAPEVKQQETKNRESSKKSEPKKPEPKKSEAKKPEPKSQR